MHKKYNKFLIVSFVGVLILGVYSYFYNDLKSEAATDSSLASSLDTTNTTGGEVAVSDQTAQDTAFITKLFSLTTIKVDTSLFTEQSFKLLVDNNIKLEPVPYGRTNPFAPTDKNAVSNKVTFSVKSNPASGISNLSAVLNGSIEGATSNNIYFEYGTDQALGKVTPKVIPSLVGNFAFRILALTPKTTYYFRTVANVNGALTFGEIISFNTN
jgi:hypothetical protein